MEFIAYSIAFSESIWLVWSIRKHRFKHELVNALILLLTCLVILLVAAFLEMAIIKSLV
jgi:glucan phosphoethanolaminetransferase (alkaline phosphatase superfamily)